MSKGKYGMAYCLQWKDPSDHSKGTIWTFMPHEVKEFAGAPHLEEEMGCMMTGHRPQLCMRGTKWKATWDENTVHTIRSSPQATRPLIASIIRRWRNPPLELQREGGKPFDINTLQARKSACVYLVELLTFEETAGGKKYYKIGKAVSVPKRIKQFGPCKLITFNTYPSPSDAFRIETELHRIFECYRKPETEIFLLDLSQLFKVINEFKAKALLH